MSHTDILVLGCAVVAAWRLRMRPPTSAVAWWLGRWRRSCGVAAFDDLV
jgi:hypothetical protein